MKVSPIRLEEIASLEVCPDAEELLMKNRRYLKRYLED
jgi:hypothetical protein